MPCSRNPSRKNGESTAQPQGHSMQQIQHGRRRMNHHNKLLEGYFAGQSLALLLEK
jgi:hypothetical protein